VTTFAPKPKQNECDQSHTNKRRKIEQKEQKSTTQARTPQIPLLFDSKQQIETRKLSFCNIKNNKNGSLPVFFCVVLTCLLAELWAAL
jgi:hypothetical protein